MSSLADGEIPFLHRENDTEKELEGPSCGFLEVGQEVVQKVEVLIEMAIRYRHFHCLHYP